ncbi:zinc finger protein 85-like protein [Aphelenchoides avenae]|nr:zinc finger protein 85-like protein [Aphelenchus avenae]
MFGGQKALEAHVKDAHGPKKWHCDTCGKGFTRKTVLNTHARVHAAKTLKCDKCDKLFTTHASLNSHAKTHEGIYSCVKCDHSFRRPSELARHVRSAHEKKKFLCNNCGKAFSIRSALKEHNVLKHGKDLGCAHDGCGYVGVDYKALEDHLVELHSDVRTRKCSICETWYITKAGLKVHVRSVHNGQYLYNCWCGFATNAKSMFEAHEANDDCTPKRLMLSNFGILAKDAKNGDLMADYVLDDDVLGRGTSGMYCARRKDDPDQSWKFAAKRIRVSSLIKSDKRSRYAKALTEATLMLKFGHQACQNLMYANAVYADDEYVSIVMDLVRPGSLSNVIKAVLERNLRFVEAAVAAVIKGATEGLVYLHENGIMHRDMKSDNVLLNEKGIAKLTDFGQTATNGPARTFLRALSRT